jgi:hypothetical protein
MKWIYRFLPMLSLLFFSIPCAAQGQGGALDFGVGIGSYHAKALSYGISSQTFDSCVPSSSNPDCLDLPSLGGVFLGFGGDAMVWNRFGIGGEISFKPVKNDYGPLQYRQMFYDINGIFAPINQDRFVLKLIGGIGGARTGFSYKQEYCVGTAICQSETTSLGTSSHFQLHAGVGLQYFVNDKVFIRPQLDLHYVPKLTDQFGSNSVVGGTIWIGFRSSEY